MADSWWLQQPFVCLPSLKVCFFHVTAGLVRQFDAFDVPFVRPTSSLPTLLKMIDRRFLLGSMSSVFSCVNWNLYNNQAASLDAPATQNHVFSFRDWSISPSSSSSPIHLSSAESFWSFFLVTYMGILSISFAQNAWRSGGAAFGLYVRPFISFCTSPDTFDSLLNCARGFVLCLDQVLWK